MTTGSATQDGLLSVARGPVEDYPQADLGRLFRERVAAAPDAVAISREGEGITYAALLESAELLARELVRRGVGKGRIVAICMDYGTDYVTAMLAVLLAGGAFMDLETDYPDRLLARALETADPAAVFVDPSRHSRLQEKWRQRAVVLFPGREFELARDAPPLPADTGVGPDDPAFCVMTSGTTGEPKAIVQTHRAAVNAYFWRYRHLPYEQGEIEACYVFFIWECLRPLLGGATLQVVPERAVYHPGELVRFLADAGITRMLFTPSLLERVLAHPGLDLSPAALGLKIVYCNGEVVPERLCRAFFERLPGVRLVNDYSISEVHDISHMELLAGRKPSGSFVPCGPPQANVSLYVLDDAGSPVVRGRQGEVYVAGAGLGAGYLGRDELTAERFVSDTVAGQGRMFRTGDAGVMAEDGSLTVLGRKAFMVKIRGYSVVPEAVAAAVAEHPEVAECAVSAAMDAERGTAERLTAFVRADPARIGGEELRAFAATLLPPWALPAKFVFVDELPVGGSGKLDRRRLEELERSGAHVWPESGGGEGGAVSETVRTVERLYAEVLGRGVRAGPDDDFFALGGDSLSTITLSAAMEREFDRPVHPVDLFTASTPRRAAALVAKGRAGAGADAVEALKPDGDRPPYVFVGSTVYLRELARSLDPRQPLYGLNLLGLADELEDASVAAVAASLARRLQKALPGGRYVLGGFCQDAKFALETARLLAADGAAVHLALVDPLWEEDSLLGALPRHLRNVVRFGPEYVRHKLIQKGWWPGGGGLVRLLRERAEHRHAQEVAVQDRARAFVRDVYHNLERFVPERWEGPVNALVCAEWDESGLQPLFDVAPQTTVVRFAGFHDTVFTPPAVLDLARRLEEVFAGLAWPGATRDGPGERHDHTRRGGP